MRSARPSEIISSYGPHKVVPRRALLIFADQLGADLTKRRLPQRLHPLFAQRLQDSATDADVHVFTRTSVARSRRRRVHSQIGSSFAERLENAIEALAKLGYDELVLIGRDCPQLEIQDVAEAFARLADHRLILGPDHRGGCYLIGIRMRDRHLLGDVHWKRNIDFAELRGRCPAGSVRVLLVKHDLDSWADVQSLARAGGAAAQLAAFFIRVLIAAFQSLASIFDAAGQRVRARWQMPPPAFAA